LGSWVGAINQWLAVIIRLAAVIAVVGLSWNAVHIIIDASMGGGGRASAAVVYRIIGIVLGLMLVVTAPDIVNALQGMLRTPLAR
jgi:hypothetical protein